MIRLRTRSSGRRWSGDISLVVLAQDTDATACGVISIGIWPVMSGTARPELGEVFGIRTTPVLSYVAREEVDGAFERAIATEHHIVVYGSSKQGKTALRQKHVSDTDCVVVRCSPRHSTIELYSSGMSVRDKNELLFTRSKINFNDVPGWQKRSTGLLGETYAREATNPKTGETVQTERPRSADEARPEHLIVRLLSKASPSWWRRSAAPDSPPWAAGRLVVSRGCDARLRGRGQKAHPRFENGELLIGADLAGEALSLAALTIPLGASQVLRGAARSSRSVAAGDRSSRVPAGSLSTSPIWPTRSHSRQRKPRSLSSKRSSIENICSFSSISTSTKVVSSPQSGQKARCFRPPLIRRVLLDVPSQKNTLPLYPISAPSPAAFASIPRFRGALDHRLVGVARGWAITRRRVVRSGAPG